MAFHIFVAETHKIWYYKYRMESDRTVRTIFWILQVFRMSVRLLDRIRKVNRLLHNNAGYRIATDELCGLFGTLMHSNVLVTDRQGKVIGMYTDQSIPVIGPFGELDMNSVIEAALNERFMSVLSTKENVNLSMIGLECDEDDLYEAIILPVDMAGERLGTVFVYRIKNPYEIDDIILGEYVTTIVAMELLHDLYDAGLYNTNRKRLVYTALHSLSESEIHAARCVLDAYEKTKGVLVTSRVAEEYGITRSVIVNAIKKLNSAGVIQSRSLGVKGTAIRIENEYIKEALAHWDTGDNLR